MLALQAVHWLCCPLAQREYTKFFFTCIYFILAHLVCIGVWGSLHMWAGQRTTCKSSLLPHVGASDQAQILQLSSKYLYPLSHLAIFCISLSLS